MGKKRKNKERIKYDPAKTMQLITLQQDLEPTARRLYEYTCCGSKELWDEEKYPEAIKSNSELRTKFMSLAHKGMRAAQEEIIEAINKQESFTASQECLYRGIANSIAWQIIGQQLCYAKRLFKGNQPPSLKHCNLESVIFAARDYAKANPDAIPLITDLTSFVQVGDILSLDPIKGVSIIEVKEGEVNYKILDFLEYYNAHKCDKVIYAFIEKEDKNTVKQLKRIIRQYERMDHVCDVLSKGKGMDPDTNTNIIITEESVMIDSWDNELNQILEESSSNGYAINIIDDCLFIGCYSGHPWVSGGHYVFNTWFDGSGDVLNCPREQLFNSMQQPLALPIFNLNIPDEFKFDLLFGRKQVCMGINIQFLISKCKNVGLEVKFATNKEATRMDQTGNRPFRYNGKAIIIGNGINELFLMDGIFLRTMFHNEKPISIVQSLLNHEYKLT